MSSRSLKYILGPFLVIWEALYLPVLAMYALACRLLPARIDVGLGPEPLINNQYHKRALKLFGYSAESFVDHVYFITRDFDHFFTYRSRPVRLLLLHVLFVDLLFVLRRYRCVYIYFNGGPLGRSRWMWRLEPLLLQIAGVRTVVMPYGSDIQSLDMTPNLYFRHCMVTDYPQHRLKYSAMRGRRLLWSSHADAVIGGCDWVDYMHHWDHLMVAHFSIDVDQVREMAGLGRGEGVVEMSGERQDGVRRPFKVLHAPNHRSIKGTAAVIRAIEELRAEGLDVELVLAERRPNAEIVRLIRESDLVVDQLVIGWYAMFAIEAMALDRPVICYLREDLVEFYRLAGLIAEHEPPLLSATPLTIKDTIRGCVTGEIALARYASSGRDYVARMHSLEAVGRKFDAINRSIGVVPSDGAGRRE